MVTKKSIVILGQKYLIKRKDFKNMEGNCGYTNHYSHEICIANAKTLPDFKNANQEIIDAFEKETLRHEIIHCFLNESGLGPCAHGTGSRSWSHNEEMIDFFAYQTPKIFKVFEELSIL